MPLSTRFRTYALDAIYDQGRSIPARPMKEIAELTAWLDDVLDALGLTDGINMMGGQGIDDRVDAIPLARECYGLMMPPVRCPVLSDDELSSIDIPALYILGEHDGATENPREVLARLGVVAPQIETMLVPGAGHDAIAAEPRLIADRTLRFLGE